MELISVIDTNVILSGLQSRRGKSFRLLNLLAQHRFSIAISVPLILEYETILKKQLNRTVFSEEEINEFINYICKVGVPTKIYYLWRPLLPDSKDDHILELAVSSKSRYVITYNVKDFIGSSKFGIKVVKPGKFLEIIGEG